MVLRGLLDRLRPVAIEDVQPDRRRKIAGTVRAASLVDELDQFRHGLSFGGGDLLDGAPKRLFKADTGLVPVDDDGPFAVLRVHDRLLRRTWHMHGTRHMGQFIRAKSAWGWVPDTDRVREENVVAHGGHPGHDA